MPQRRRLSRERRAHHPARPSHAPNDRRAARDGERREAEFRAGQQKIARRRDLVALLAVPILLLTVACGSVPLPFVCSIPQEVLMLLFSAVFGSYLGMTIRLFLDRRRYAREVRPSTS